MNLKIYSLIFTITNNFILGLSREDFALSLLEQFKNKLHSAIQLNQEKTSKELLEDDDNWYVFY